jgi:hypothetical protein
MRPRSAAHGSRPLPIWAAVLVLCALALAAAACASPDTGSRVDAIPETARRQEARFGESIRLVAFELDPPVMHPSGVLDLTLYWESDAPARSDYVVLVEIIGPSGARDAYKERAPVDGARPTTSWRTGEIIIDRYRLALSGQGHAGFYRVWVGMLDPDGGMQRLPVFVNGERLEGDAIRLDMVVEAEP